MDESLNVLLSNELHRKNVKDGLRVFKKSDNVNWKILDRPGYLGKKREQMYQTWNETYGKDNWRIAYIWGDKVINREMAIQIYEDAYYAFLKCNEDKLIWLISNAADIYDTAPTNVLAELSYEYQETPNNHIHDVSIRRAVLRLGESFKGDRLIQVRWVNSEGYSINPGVVPSHIPGKIKQPNIAGWWQPNSIEDFYQSNKVLQVKS